VRYTRVLPQEPPDAHSLAQLFRSDRSEDEGSSRCGHLCFALDLPKQNSGLDGVRCVLGRGSETRTCINTPHNTVQPNQAMRECRWRKQAMGMPRRGGRRGMRFQAMVFKMTPKGKCDKTALVTLANPWSRVEGAHPTVAFPSLLSPRSGLSQTRMKEELR
jgi:hypothetical protein